MARRRNNMALSEKGCAHRLGTGQCWCMLEPTTLAPDLLGAVRVSGESTMQMQPCVPPVTVR